MMSCATRAEGAPAGGWVTVGVGLVSAALLSYEIALMRRVLVEHWHHMSYLAISVALLGFGASGTLLALGERLVRARPHALLRELALALLVSLAVMPRLTALLPVAGRFIPHDLWAQVGWWSLYWLVTMVPFLVGAASLGAALMSAGPRIGQVYAANLAGSAAGALVAMLPAARWPIDYGFWPALSCAAAASLMFCLVRESRERGRRSPTHGGLLAVLVILIAITETRWPLKAAYEEHKYAARLQQLERQGAARRVARQADPHGYVELYESDLFHDLPFLSLATAPPPMYSLVVNGDAAGSVLRIDSPAQAEVMDQTLMALPYRLVPHRPRVLLLGETGGTNVWLARRRNARQITVVQPNAAVLDLVRQVTPAVYDAESVVIRRQTPREFLNATGPGAFDLIQIVAMEGLGAGSAGLRGLTEDHLPTVEGFSACLRALSDEGLVAITRGVEEPPRENVRLLATLAEALHSLGVEDPARHIVQVRDYLGVCTLALRRPLTTERRADLRTAIIDFNLTPVWYEGLPPEEVNQPDQLAGPPGTGVDWLHYAACEVFSERREQFYTSWLFNVRPVHDDNPFFWDLYKKEAISALRRAYGDLWLTRAELGRLYLYASVVLAGLAALLLILLPLVFVTWQRSVAARGRRRVFAMVVYFASIGAGFMWVEMALISRATQQLGDAVRASALVIGGVLVTSGLGSLTSSQAAERRPWLAPLLVGGTVFLMRGVAWTAMPAGLWVPVLLAIVVAFLMGIPMPTGLRCLGVSAPHLVPWAWGLNGVASVLGASTALVVAMNMGYGTVLVLAAGAYLLAVLSANGLYQRPRETSPAR